MAENITSPCEQCGRPTVVAVDGSAFSYHAVAWAAADAALYRRGLRIVASVRTGFGPGSWSTDTDAVRRRNGERILAKSRDIARKAAPDETLTVETELIDDPIVAYLTDRSRLSRMVVFGHRGLGAFTRRLPGSVSTAVIKNAHCPVAVVRSAPATDAESAGMPVLVGVKGTRDCGSAVRLAFDEASRREVELIALHAWSDTRGTNLIPSWEAVRELEDAALAENLAGFGERYPEVPVRRILAHDSPVRCLTDEARSAQLLVVGSCGRKGATGILHRSVTSALVNSVECPVIVAREP
ncbi:universal stress protein [Nocardia arthritidis]|uniref:universal stress protein n=1 Tax=Nocardia arthritidis TaxID=228602 RepID=UPI0007A4E645|nr:universal stress protein [Nocardia arthritidis]